jgi:hypothetical protein
MGVLSWLGKGRWSRGARVGPALALVVLAAALGSAAERVVIVEEFADND